MAPKSVQDLKKYVEALSKHWTLAINLQTFKRPSQYNSPERPCSFLYSYLQAYRLSNQLPLQRTTEKTHLINSKTLSIVNLWL